MVITVRGYATKLVDWDAVPFVVPAGRFGRFAP